MTSLSLVFSACAFASGFALRTVDPLILPIAQRFDVTPATAALLTSAYALPYALGQPFLGPLGDRFGKVRCIQACIVVLAAALVLGALAPSFQWLLVSRLLAGAFAGGLIPLVLAGLGDSYDLRQRQVIVGRLLVAIISGQMLGSAAAGLVSDAFGWRGAMALAAAVAVVAAASTWATVPRASRGDAPSPATSFAGLYAQVFDNPKAFWLCGAVVAEGTLVFAPFPCMGQLLIEHAGSAASADRRRRAWCWRLSASAASCTAWRCAASSPRSACGAVRDRLRGAGGGLRRLRRLAHVVAVRAVDRCLRHGLLHAAQLSADRSDQFAPSARGWQWPCSPAASWWVRRSGRLCSAS